MTRINVGINPKNLTDQHLKAELRELPRIFTAVAKRIKEKKNFNDIPSKFTLGTGHVKFFYDNCGYLADRHVSLRREFMERYNHQYDFDPNRVSVPDLVFNDYNPTEEDKNLLIERISKRITESKQTPYYYGKKITKDFAIKILTTC